MSERSQFPVVIYKHPDDKEPTIRLTFRVPQNHRYSVSVLHVNCQKEPVIGKPIRSSMLPTAKLTPYIELRPKILDIPANPVFPYRELALEVCTRGWRTPCQEVALIRRDAIVFGVLRVDLIRRRLLAEIESDEIGFIGAYKHD